MFTLGESLAIYAPWVCNWELDQVTSTLLVAISITFLAAYTVLWLLWSVFIYRPLLSPFKNLPQPPGNLIFGQTYRILREDVGEPMRDWMENVPNDGLIKYTMRLHERLMVTSPKMLSEILNTHNYDFSKPAHFRLAFSRFLGSGLFLAEGEEHKQQRKIMMPAFSYRRIQDLYPVFWAKSQEMVDCLLKSSTVEEPSAPTDAEVSARNSGSVEVGEWASRATLDIIGLAAMGRDFNSLRDPQNELSSIYRKVFAPPKTSRCTQILGMILPTWLLRIVATNREMNEAHESIKRVCQKLISERRRAREEKGTVYEVDLLSALLDSDSFSDQDLVYQMMTFLAAGHETTAVTLMWAIYLLCVNPEVQQKLHNEVRSVIPSRKDGAIAGKLDRCRYLNGFCMETLRLCSPVARTQRIAVRDTILGDQFVPKGTVVVLPVLAINTSTKMWGTDAMDLKPERWIESEGGGAESNYSFMSFLHGPRSCIAQRFAMAEFACLLAAWVGTFKSRLEDNTELAKNGPQRNGVITVKPNGGVWVRLEQVPGW